MASADDEVAAAGGGSGGGGGGHVIEVVDTNEEEASVSVSAAAAAEEEEEITPLLVEVQEKPKMSIFSVSYPNNNRRRRPPREPALRAVETECTLLNNFILWVWSGSRFSGLLCVASSSAIYCIMEVFMATFSGRSIPLFEIVFVRCTIILILSIVWLRRTGQPIFGPTNIRKLLLLRALTGYLSLTCFIYSIQNLPLPYAIVLNFSTPFMASVAARTILQEKLTLPDIGGLACSFLGLLFIFRPKFIMEGGLAENGDKIAVTGARHLYLVFVGLLSSIAGGISFCLIKAGAKTADQPVYTVLAFGILASPISAICALSFQVFLLPDLSTFFVMVILGVLAFFAEVSLARGFQLEKISKAANIQFFKVLLSQMWGIAFVGVTPTFSRLVGCLLILASVCSTLYFGTEKEAESGP